MAITDPGYSTSEQQAPASDAAAVTPHDSTEFAVRTRALYIGSGGALTVTMIDGSNVTFVGVVAGSVLPLRVIKVLATGTTASSIVALF